MSPEQIAATVNRILQDEFEIDAARIKPSAQLINDLDLDSLDAVDLIAALESELGGRVAEDEARKVRTVSDVYKMVEHQLQARV